MSDQHETCRCNHADHGHEPNRCDGEPRELDGLCQHCSDLIARTMGDIMPPLNQPPTRS
jgi:hypothetical protein